jgi:hypothetical protein
MSFKFKTYSELEGYKTSVPEKMTIDYITELIKATEKGDMKAAHSLAKIAKGTAPSYTAPVAAHIHIGSGDNGVVTVTADTAWAAGNNLTLQVAVAAGANAALAATFVGNDILVTLGTTSEAGTPDAAKNTATLVMGIINAISGKIFTATKSGSGATAIPAAVAKANLTGGVDEVLTLERTVYNLAVDKFAGNFTAVVADWNLASIDVGTVHDGYMPEA